MGTRSYRPETTFWTISSAGISKERQNISTRGIMISVTDLSPDSKIVLMSSFCDSSTTPSRFPASIKCLNSSSIKTSVSRVLLLSSRFKIKSGVFSSAATIGNSSREISSNSGDTADEICMGYVTPNVLGMASPARKRIIDVTMIEIHWPLTPNKLINREAARMEILMLTASLLVTTVMSRRLGFLSNFTTEFKKG